MGLRQNARNFCPVGALMRGGTRSQGLTPLAIDLRPFGTKSNESLAAPGSDPFSVIKRQKVV